MEWGGGGSGSWPWGVRGFPGGGGAGGRAGCLWDEARGEVKVEQG